MAPGRKRLAQLRVIYDVPKVLLCILYSLLPFTLLLSLRKLPCIKPFASSPCPGREEGGHLFPARDGLCAGGNTSIQEGASPPVPLCSACPPTHWTSQRIDLLGMELQEPGYREAQGCP